jgi:hypothetical protein
MRVREHLKIRAVAAAERMRRVFLTVLLSMTALGQLLLWLWMEQRSPARLYVPLATRIMEEPACGDRSWFSRPE